MGIKVWVTSQDGSWSVIEAKDYQPGLGRSRTRDTPGEALKAPWDPALNTPVGPGSMHKFVLVRSMDIMGPRLPVSPKSYMGKQIPDYPHRCPNCGGRMLILFSSIEHEGGECPGPPKRKSSLWA